MTETIKPLIFYMRAANYPDIIKELDQIPCDKFIVNYMPYPFPHDMARQVFLEHDEYTHLIVMPQDLKVTKEDFDNLMLDIKKYDYPVISCVCNVEEKGHRNFGRWAICAECPSKDYSQRRHNWIPAYPEKFGIIQVGFTGFVFCAIKKHVILRMNSRTGEHIFKGCIHTDGSPSPDLNFCLNCKELGIPIHADTDIRLYHYANHKELLVGKKNPSTILLKNGAKIEEWDKKQNSVKQLKNAKENREPVLEHV